MRCSLREPHPAHSLNVGGGTGYRCDGKVPPPRSAPVIDYVLPLDRRGRRARMSLPEDLTDHEAARLTAMIRTLPLP